MRTILIRADSSSSIGTGHIMRDLVLAKQFSDDRIIFATRELEGHINHKIKESGYHIVNLETNTLDELVSLVNKWNADIVVIDHYDIDAPYEKELKERTGVKLFVLDDTYERHYCDILLNHNIYANPIRYYGLVPKNCELRCGEAYTLLRDEFIESKQSKKETDIKQKDIKTIFVAMGGTDVANLNPRILRVLENFEHIKVHIVTTTANPHLEGLKNFVEGKEWITLHVNSTQIAKLMAQSDLAIVTPSVTMNEVWYMKIPFIAIKVADNQKYMYEFLKRKVQLVLIEYNQSKLYNLLTEKLGW